MGAVGTGFSLSIEALPSSEGLVFRIKYQKNGIFPISPRNSLKFCQTSVKPEFRRSTSFCSLGRPKIDSCHILTIRAHIALKPSSMPCINSANGDQQDFTHRNSETSGYKYHGFFTQMQMLINLYEVSIYTGTERATQERRDTWYRRMSASCRVDTPW